MWKRVYTVEHDLRMKFVADDGRDFGDDGMMREWLVSRSRKEQLRIMQQNPAFDARQCYRLWRWAGRTDKVPRGMYIFLDRGDFDRIWPETTQSNTGKSSGN